MWATLYLEGTNRSAEHLRQNIAENIMELKDLYTHDAIQRFNDNGMLFVDGCSLLQILLKFELLRDTIRLMGRDVLLLENQLPFKLLKRLRFRVVQCCTQVCLGVELVCIFEF